MNKTDLFRCYNMVKIVKAIDLVKLSKTYKDNNEIVIAMFKKKDTNPDRLERIEKSIAQILERLTKIEENQAKDHALLLDTRNLLDKVILLNNLRTE